MPSSFPLFSFVSVILNRHNVKARQRVRTGVHHFTSPQQAVEDSKLDWGLLGMYIRLIYEGQDITCALWGENLHYTQFTYTMSHHKTS